jgi:hypothetical protein
MLFFCRNFEQIYMIYMHMCYILGVCNLSNITHAAYEEANVLTPTEGMAMKMHENNSFEIKLFCKLVKDPNLFQ